MMKTKRKLPSLLVAGCIILITLALGIAIGICIHSTLIYGEPEGRILLSRRINPDLQDYEMLIMDGNGNYIQWLSEIYGSPTWSPSGRWIAADCPEGGPLEGNLPEFNLLAREICIFDAHTINNMRDFPLVNPTTRPTIASRLELPGQCTADFPTRSISWSPDEKKLAVVCISAESSAQNRVCILSTEGKADCWDESLSEEVYKAVWSPVEDLLVTGGATDYSSKLYLVHPDGTNPVYLVDGWSPEWSPDGKKIAFIRQEVMEEDVRPLENGIATINKDGSNMRWLYLSNTQIEGLQKTLFFIFCAPQCPLAWSPDGRYIAFIASSVHAYEFDLYRLDIKTGKIISLIDTLIIGNYIFELDWGP